MMKWVGFEDFSSNLMREIDREEYATENKYVHC